MVVYQHVFVIELIVGGDDDQSNDDRDDDQADEIRAVAGEEVAEVGPEDIDEEVSIRFLADTPQNALKELAIKLGASLSREAFSTYRMVKLPLVSLTFEDADVRTVIKQIAKLADGNVVINEGVQGTVSLRVENVTWRAALENVVRTSGFQIVEEGLVGDRWLGGPLFERGQIFLILTEYSADRVIDKIGDRALRAGGLQAECLVNLRLEVHSRSLAHRYHLAPTL